MAKKRTVYRESMYPSATRNEMRMLYEEMFGGRAKAFREAVTPTWSKTKTQAEIDAEILKREALWIQQAAPEQVNALSRRVVSPQKRLSKRVTKPKWADHPRFKPSDEDIRLSNHKRRPTIRRIKGSNWRLAGTAHAANTYAEQIAISQALAKSIRQVGAKARVIKWKNQVGVYYQPRLDPIEKIWGQSSGLKTNKPASYVWEPAVYGRRKSASNKTYLKDMSVDCSGMRCPYPVLNAKKALAEMEPGDTLTLVATDWEAEYDVPMLASRYGHNLQSIQKNEATGEITFTITKGNNVYGKKMPSWNDAFADVSKYGAGQMFPEGARPAEKRKLLVIQEPGEIAQYQQYGMTNGVSMGWVTRSEAAQILGERGIYPTGSQFDRAFKDELAQDKTVSGLKQAEKRAKERELWKDSLTIMREAKGDPEKVLEQSSAGLDDYSWSILDIDELADGESPGGAQLYCLYDKVSAVGVGDVGPQLEGIDLYNAYREFLVEDGFSEDDITEFLMNTAEFELRDLFHCSDTAQELKDNAQKSIVEMQKITGFRDGKELGEWNEIQPLKTKLWLKSPDEIDWSNEATAAAARDIIWNTEFMESPVYTGYYDEAEARLSLGEAAVERAIDQYRAQQEGRGTISGRSDQKPRSNEETRRANLKSKIEGRKFRKSQGLNIEPTGIIQNEPPKSEIERLFDEEPSEKEYNRVDLDFKNPAVVREWNKQPIPEQYFGTDRMGWNKSRRGKEEMVKYLWYRNQNGLGPARTSEILGHLNRRLNGNFTANQISNFLGKDIRFVKQSYRESNDRGFRVREQSWDLNYDLKVKQ
jgi:tRNA 2-thiouridine synthesizing protein A